jgi:hypothetical protein
MPTKYPSYAHCVSQHVCSDLCEARKAILARIEARQNKELDSSQVENQHIDSFANYGSTQCTEN